MAEAPAFLALAWQTTAAADFTLANTITSEAALKALPSVSVAVPHVYLASTATGGQLNHWLLRAGTDAEDSGIGILRPDDYADTTNEKILEKWS